MGMRGFFMVAIMLSTLLCYCESEEQLIELSRDELLEIEDQLERLNKSSIKTIKTYYGDIYDCIDFYEQPAFDHPLLKNRKYDFQMKPSSHMAPMVREDKPPKNVRQVSINSGLKGEKCPTGFVPIRRTTKEDLIRAKLFTKSYTSRINSPPTSHHALVYTSDSTKKYNGGGTIASFYTLYNVTDSQYTFGRIKLQNGLDIIQAGWGVNPSVYGDNKTRIFIYFQAGELSCFNTVCPGFVLVDPQPMIDRILRETHPGTFPTWEIGIYIYRDQVTGNWWLQLTKDHDQIGYWPSSIFSGGLKDLATYIDWGGETYSPLGQIGPPMGSGLLLKQDTRYDAYCRELTTINEGHIQEDAKNTKISSIDIDFYLVKDWGFHRDFGHVMTYGGPGPR
ncbi:protein neprosin-like [Cannabis sativa]|uniref:protein neprosin-like n=1 Tax=Cannabis sativa TaxID=3483 RepID=UPI0029C9BEB6|nr:protein neprosin-like [Cannabis sativa]XP_060965728.1 protein neprosin-like [Cannabis sativa]